MRYIPAKMVSRAEVEAVDTRRIVQVATRCVETYQTTGTLESIVFGITGYDDDLRHLCTIPEVRSWCTRLCDEFPILALIEPTTVEWFLPCIADIKVVRTNISSTLLEWPKDWYATIEPFMQKAFELIWSLSPSDAERCRLRDECVARCKAGFKLIGLQ